MSLSGGPLGEETSRQAAMMLLDDEVIDDLVYRYRAEVVRVIDGDTVVCDVDLGFNICMKKESVRLAKIDTPEVRTKDKEEKARGLAAKAFVEELLPPGTVCVLESVSFSTGKYGRIIANVVLPDGRCLNDLLLEEGHAEPYL